MAGAIGLTAALPARPAPRRLPLRRLAPTSAAVGSTWSTSVPSRLAAQLRQLKQFKVWDAPSSAAGADRASSQARNTRSPHPARQGAPADGGARPGAGGGRRPGIVWFRGDLRLHDHEALSRAQAECSSLLPVYCFDPRDYGKSPQGYDKTGPYRAQFLIEAVADLRAALRAAGSELVVRLGRPEEVVSELVRRTGAGAVYCHTEVSFEDLRVERAVKAAAEGAGASFRAFWGGTLAHLEDLPFRLQQLPQNFDSFRSQLEPVAIRAALPAPEELHGLPLGGRMDPGELPSLKQLGLQPLPSGSRTTSASGGPGKASAAAAGGLDGSMRGGEREGERQLQRFVAQAAAAAGCSGARQAVGAGAGGAAPRCGAAYSSNFASNIAPWLAAGCLSPRRMLEDVQRAVGQAGAPAGQPQHPLNWVRFELLWRDFFRFVCLKYSTATLPAAPGAAAGAAASVGKQALVAAA